MKYSHANACKYPIITAHDHAHIYIYIYIYIHTHTIFILPNRSEQRFHFEN